MENFKDYQFADLTPKSKSTIVQLEQQMKQETGKDVVLIAYQQNNKTQG